MAEDRGLGVGTHGNLIHVHLAQQDTARRFQSADSGGGIGRDIALQHLGRAGNRQAGGAQVVLYRKGDSGQRRREFSRPNLPLDLTGPFHGPLPVQRDKGVDPVVFPLNGLKGCLYDLRDRPPSLSDPFAQFQGGHCSYLHDLHSAVLGTR